MCEREKGGEAWKEGVRQKQKAHHADGVVLKIKNKSTQQNINPEV